MPDESRHSRDNTTGARRRGRPPGSRNKPKVDPSVARSLRDTIGPYLPREDLDYLLQSLEGTTERELDKDLLILLSLQFKALLPVLANEINEGKLSREATQRSATVKELLALWLAKQKQEKGDDRSGNTFIQNLILARGIDTDRLALLLGGEGLPRLPEGQPGLLSRGFDDDARQADRARTVSGQLPEGQEQVPPSSQE